MASFLWMAGPGVAPAGASPSQSAGSEVAAYQPGWTWTYAETYTIDSPVSASQANVEYFNLDENVTYTVQGIVSHTNYTCPPSYQGGVCTSSTPGATPAGTYNTYQINFSGSVTGGSGQAQGQNLSITTGSSSMSGTEWVEVGNLATVEVDQTQNISGKAAGIVTVTLSLQNDNVYTPAQVVQDFRLHNTDSWLENTNVYDNGVVNYNAGSFGSGTSPIDSYGPINATATDSSATVSEPIASNIPVDSINYNDTVNTTSETRDWSNTYHNVAFDNFLTGVPQGQTCSTSSTSSCEQTTMALASASTPNPALSVSESIGGLTNGVACGGESVPVTGTLGTGASGVSVQGTLDQSTVSPNTGVVHTTTTGTGGSYALSFTAPTSADSLQKPGVKGTWPIEVSAGGANNAVTLEVGPQDCSSTSYTGAAFGPVGSSQPVSAQVTDIGTGLPVSGATVVFALNGNTAQAVTGSNGAASTNLVIAGPVGGSTITASTAATATETASSATSPFTVQLDPTATALVASEPSASLGDGVTFTAQVGAAGPTSGPITGSVAFFVDGSQLGTAVALNGSGSATSVADNTMTLGSHDITAVYSGSATYATSMGEIPAYRVHPPLTPTSTTLLPTPNPSVFGQSVTLQATVTATSGTPDGAVAFYDGATLLGTGTLNQANPDTVSISVSSLSTGSHSLTADYQGDNEVTFDASNSPPVVQTVQAAQTATTVSSTNNPTVAGEGTTFDIAVAAQAPGAGTPTGTVQVSVNGTPLGGPVGLSGGTATVGDALGAGSYTVSAVYSGDSNFSTSSGSTMQTVVQAGTTTTLISNPDPSIQNQSVTFTATVSPNAPGGGTPSGLVTFTTNGGATTLGSAGLSPSAGGAVASIQLANLPLGDTVVTATYAGDPNFTASSSSPDDQNVQPAPPVVDTTTVLSSSQQPSVYGQAVTFTAVVTANSGPNIPTGTVQFSVDGADIGGPVPLNPSGVAASAPIATLAAGGHAVIAAYSGDNRPGNFGFNQSGQVFTQQVQQAATTVSGSPSANPDPYGQAETFSVAVSAVVPGAAAPTGQVQFSLDGAPIGTPVGLDANGDASTGAVNGLTPGLHTVSYVTSGDPNFLGTNGSFTFTVSKIPTQTALQVSPNPAVFGQSVTMTATVTHATGPGTPGGTVTFADGSTTLAIVAVTNGTAGSATASFTTSALSAGSHSIAATYNGDANFAGSSSAATQLSVARAPTVVTVTPPTLYIHVISLLNIQVNFLKLVATLTSNGVPVAGQTLTFEANAGTHPVICSGVTDSNGQATCVSTIAGATEGLLAGSVLVVYSGNASYIGTSGTAPLIKIQL
jgi:hypothetical protein